MEDLSSPGDANFSEPLGDNDPDPSLQYPGDADSDSTSTSRAASGWLAVCGFSLSKSALTTLLEFPAENLSVRMQGRNQTDFFKTCKAVWKQEGVSGFYRGWLPGYLRTLAKAGYQWSWISTLQNSLVAHSLDEIDPRKNLKNGVIGLAVACMDTALLTPLEKAKIETILDSRIPPERPRLPDLIEGETPQKLVKKWLQRIQPYRGATPFFMEQWLGWTLFLVGQNEGQSQAKETFGEENAAFYKPALGVILGGLDTAFSLPFANIRTRMIMNHTSWTARQILGSVQEMGTPGLYYGWKPALLKATIAGVCDIYFISYLEAKSKESKELQ